MKYFAKLDDTNKVIEAICVHDNEAPTEQAGIDFLTKLYNHSSWKQSFEDGTRKNQAGKGMQYDSTRNAFIHKQPYASWILNESTCRWDAPTSYPDDGKVYDWNEETTSWEEIMLPT